MIITSFRTIRDFPVAFHSAHARWLLKCDKVDKVLICDISGPACLITDHASRSRLEHKEQLGVII